MALETITECPLCSSKETAHFMTTKDHSISKEEFSISQCASCGFVFTNPRPSHSDIGKYYQSDEYISHTNKSTSLISILYKIVRKYTLSQKLSLINSISDKGKILDFGCGTGYFIQTCLKNGWEAYGIEPDNAARQLASNRLKKTVHKNITDLPTTGFEVITLWHVLEHVHNLHHTFSTLVSLLTKNGKMIIAVPNHRSYDAEIYKEYWAGYDLPRHLYHFTRKTVNIMAETYGLKISKIIPMKFDSFYVSLLSDKYMNKKRNMLKPIITAYKSNYYANKSREYSSLIYVLSK